MPFSYKKYKETKKYDVNPIVLPVFHEESDEVDSDNSSHHGTDEAGTGINCTTVNDDDNVVLSECVRVCTCMCVHAYVHVGLSLILHQCIGSTMETIM